MDYSGMSRLLTCARSYQYGVEERLMLPREKPSINFGHAWHAIQHKYAVDQNFFGIDEEAGVRRLLASRGWQDHEGDYRTGEKLALGFRRWLERYSGAAWKVIEAETSYRHLLVKGFEPQEGRVDAIVEWNSNQGRGVEKWIVDFKTTSMLRGDWVEVYRNSNQFRFYYMAMLGKYPDLAGVVVDLYHATKGVQKGKTAEEREGNRFYRLPVRFEEFQLEEATRDYGVAIVAKQVYTDAGYFPKNTSACVQYGVACPFLELCDAPSEEARQRLRATYVENPFDVHAPVEV